MADISIGKNKRLLHFIGAAYINGYLWTSALEWNGYYRVDVKTGKAEFFGLFKYADVFADKLFNQVLSCGKFVFFIPWFSNYLVRLNTENLDTKYWKLPEHIVVEIAKFRVANIYNGKIFMFPRSGEDICIFDMEEECFECDRKWVKDYIKLEKCEVKDWFLNGCQKGEIVYLANYSSSFLMKYNMKNYEMEIIPFLKSDEKVMEIIEYRKNDLFVLTALGNVWRFDTDSEKKELIYKYEGTVKLPYIRIVGIQNRLYLIPEKEVNVICLDDKGFTKILYPVDWRYQYINVGMGSTFYGYFMNEDNFILYPCQGNMLLKLEIGKKCFSGIEIYEDSKDRGIEISKYLERNDFCEMIMEEPKAHLNLLLNVFAKKNRLRNSDYLFTNGMCIWNQMKGT